MGLNIPFDVAHLDRKAWLQAVAVGTIVLITGFGDGVGYALTTLTGQRSPWIFLLPVLALPLGARSCHL